MQPPQSSAPSNAALGALTEISRAINNLQQTMARVFPLVLATADSATGGASIALPTHPMGFIEVINPADGSTVLVPYYSP